MEGGFGGRLGGRSALPLKQPGQRFVRLKSGLEQQDLRQSWTGARIHGRTLLLVVDPAFRRSGGVCLPKQENLPGGAAGWEHQSARSGIHRAALNDHHRSKIRKREKPADVVGPGGGAYCTITIGAADLADAHQRAPGSGNRRRRKWLPARPATRGHQLPRHSRSNAGITGAGAGHPGRTRSLGSVG